MELLGNNKIIRWGCLFFLLYLHCYSPTSVCRAACTPAQAYSYDIIGSGIASYTVTHEKNKDVVRIILPGVNPEDCRQYLFPAVLRTPCPLVSHIGLYGKNCDTQTEITFTLTHPDTNVAVIPLSGSQGIHIELVQGERALPEWIAQIEPQASVYQA